MKKITYNKILKSVLKPTRYLGNEMNSIIKDWSGLKIKIALCFPDTYEIGMSHLGLRILYHYLNQRKDWCAERVYMPWVDMADSLRKESFPLFSLESKKSLNEFDVIGFSFQYELEYSNVLEMLDLGGIPTWSKDRNDADPIVIAGGPVVFNPEPMADFIDIFLIGDGEEAFPKIVETIEDLKDRGFNRESIIGKLSKVGGVYVPSLYTVQIDEESNFSIVQNPNIDSVPFPVKRSLLEDINRFPFPSDIVVPFGRIVHDRISVELSRGCTQGCRFCQAGTIYRPVRERDPKSISETINSSLKLTGYDEASLTSLSSADYSGIELLAEKLMNDLEEADTSLSISSLRVYGITEALAKQIARVRKTGFTVAPEAGSQRLRDIINKGISEEDIFSGVSNAFDQGWKLIKLYLMIGLPGETDEDVLAIAELAQKIIKIGRKKLGNKVKLNVSVNTFVPKPHTAFQWCGVLPEELVRKRQQMILEQIKSDKAISVSFNDYRLTRLEVILSRGDRKLGKAIYKAWQDGARLDAWMEHFRPQIWENAFTNIGLDTSPYLSAIDVQSKLPWDHIDTLVEKNFLLKEYNKSLKAQITPACEQPLLESADQRVEKVMDGSKYVCYNCGVNCDLPAIKKRQVANLKYLKNAVKSYEAESSSEKFTDENRKLWHYKIIYAKQGEMQYVSQLDMVRILTHTFRRAEIPVARTLGFNPRPKFWFAASPGVGIEGENEVMGFSTIQSIDVDRSLIELNKALPKGLFFRSMNELRSEEVKKEKIVTEKYYRFSHLPDDTDPALLKEQIDGQMSLQSIRIERTVKKKKKVVEVRPLIKEVILNPEKMYLDIHCYETDTAGVRPENLTRLFLNLDISDVRVQRLWIKGAQ